MNNKDMLVRIDASAIAILEQEMKSRRNTGAANSVGDRFLIRLLEAWNNNTKTFLFKIEKNKIVIKNYPTFVYDDNRQAGVPSGETDRTSSSS